MDFSVKALFTAALRGRSDRERAGLAGECTAFAPLLENPGAGRHQLLRAAASTGF